MSQGSYSRAGIHWMNREKDVIKRNRKVSSWKGGFGEVVLNQARRGRQQRELARGGCHM